MSASMTLKAGRPPHPDALVALWLFACAAMILLMVVIGGITRLTESGLSITEWKPLTGIIPPLTQAEWERSFALYRQIPEYQLLNKGMSLAEYKSIYWWEFIHRLWGRLIGIAFAVPLAIFLLRRRIGRALAPWLGLLFLLGALQGALGWYMVASGLSERTDVSQYRLAAHFSLAVALYAAVLWTAVTLVRPAPDTAHEGARLRPWLIGALALIVLTMIAGAFVAGLNAGFLYNEFPWMGEGLVPPDYNHSGAGFWENALENPAAAQLHHRVLAVASLAAVLATWWRGLRLRLPHAARTALALFALMGVVQLGLGILTLVLVVPIPLAALHQAGALMLLSFGLWALLEARAPASLRERAPAY
jgi:cytochrome c oxidase assembly protein subunit 15